jgi:DNA-binding response OmpR family regulator
MRVPEEIVTATPKRCDGLDVVLDGAGQLIRGRREVQLWIRERQLVAVLLSRWPRPLTPSEVDRVLWPVSPPSETTRRVAMTRLRRRLMVVGLALRCRAREGYTLEASRWTLDGAEPDHAMTSAPTR